MFHQVLQTLNMLKTFYFVYNTIKPVALTFTFILRKPTVLAYTLSWHHWIFAQPRYSHQNISDLSLTLNSDNITITLAPITQLDIFSRM